MEEEAYYSRNPEFVIFFQDLFGHLVVKTFQSAPAAKISHAGLLLPVSNFGMYRFWETATFLTNTVIFQAIRNRSGIIEYASDIMFVKRYFE